MKYQSITYQNMKKIICLMIYNGFFGAYLIASFGMSKKTLLFLVVCCGVGFILETALLMLGYAGFLAAMLIQIRGLLQCGVGLEAMESWHKDVIFFLIVYGVVYIVFQSEFYKRKVMRYGVIILVPFLLVLTYIHGPLENSNARLYIGGGIMSFPVLIMLFPFVVAAMLYQNTEMKVSHSKKSLPVNQFAFVAYCIFILIMSAMNEDLGVAAVLVLTGLLTFFLYARNGSSRLLIVVGGMISAGLLIHISSRIQKRWLVFYNLKEAAQQEETAKDAAFFVFEHRILQHSGWKGLGLGSTNILVENKSYPTLINDYIFSKIVIELGVIFGIVVILIFLALVLELLKLPAVHAFDELLNLAIAVEIFVIGFLNIASSQNAIPAMGIPFLALSEGHSLFIALAALVAIHDGIKRRELDDALSNP